ncbi:MAG: hypothetical protein ABI389_13725 [Rhodanobacter sp.]
MVFGGDAVVTTVVASKTIRISAFVGILQQAQLAVDGTGSELRSAIGSDSKGRLSPVRYLTGIAMAFLPPSSAQLLYVLAALLWLVPDRRIGGGDRSRG